MRRDVSAVARVQWLAEVAVALERAQKLVWQLGQAEDPHTEAMELYGRLEAARQDVQALRKDRAAAKPVQYPPDWIDLSPWSKNPRSGA